MLYLFLKITLYVRIIHLVGRLVGWLVGYLFIYLFSVYLLLGETETECKWLGAERVGDTESKAGPWLRAISTEPDVGL